MTKDDDKNKIEETLIEKLADISPEIFEELNPLFLEKSAVYIPEVILKEKIEDFNQKLRLKLDITAIADKESQKKGSYLLKLDELLELYRKEWAQARTNIPDIILKKITHESKIQSTPSYISNFNIVKDPENEKVSYSMFDAVINREAAYSCNGGTFGLQKIEGIVDIRDTSNPNRFIQLMVTEISREKDDENIGHYIVVYKNSTHCNLGHHVWLFPKKRRTPFRQLPGLFKQFILDMKYSSVPPFEWIEDKCGEDMNISDIKELAENPDLVIDRSDLIADVLSRPETEKYQEIVKEIPSRMEEMCVPRDIAEKIESAHKTILQDDTIVIPNPQIEARSQGNLKELDIEKLRKAIERQYNGQTIDNRFMDGDTLRFSELYYVDKADCPHPKKNEYSVFQLYVHRPSSRFEEEKFESFLDIVNTEDPENRFSLKIEEIKRTYNNHGIYSIELFINGNKLEHHMHVVEADRENMIDLPKQIREIVKKNGYRSAPEYAHIYKNLGCRCVLE